LIIVIPGRAKRESRVVDIFSSVQARVIDLMGGGAAEMVFLGDAPPMFMARDMLGANAIAGVVLRHPGKHHGLRRTLLSGSAGDHRAKQLQPTRSFFLLHRLLTAPAGS
jgi:hypothetical protein